MNYALHVIILVSLYTILGLSLNLSVGYGGMLSLCHAAFYGIGAYASTLLMIKAGLPFLPSLLAAVLLTGIAAQLISIPSSRFHGDFFVLATLGFQMIATSLFHNWTGLTQGPYGIPGIPKPSVFGLRINSPDKFFIFTMIASTAVCFLTWRVVHSPFGRTLQAVRDDELAAMAMGKDVLRFRRTAFTIGGALAGCAGVLFASYATYIDPTSFTLDESVFILSVVIIGGTGNLRGPILGAVVVVLLPELLRFFRIPDAVAANARQIIYGLLLVLMMRFRPQGIAGKYAFD